MLKGVEDLADAVKVTMGPKVMLFFSMGYSSLNPILSLMQYKGTFWNSKCVF